MKSDKFEEMTARIVAQLEKGIVPWRRTWNQITMGAARNHFSGHIYQGINRFILDGFEVPRFATFNQVSNAGHRIRKGAKSLPVYFWKILFFDANGKRVETGRKRKKLFHTSQSTGFSTSSTSKVLPLKCSGKTSPKPYLPGLMNVKPF